MAKQKKIEPTEREERKAAKTAKKDFVFAVGRRKDAVARVRLYPLSGKNEIAWNDLTAKKGDVLVNGKQAGDYFKGEAAKAMYTEPYRATNTIGSFITTVQIQGGGFGGQLGAFIHGVSRALSIFDPEKFRPILKKKGFLTRDSRTRQRRKVGMGGKSRRKKQSPKR